MFFPIRKYYHGLNGKMPIRPGAPGWVPHPNNRFQFKQVTVYFPWAKLKSEYRKFRGANPKLAHRHGGATR
jgi:hypothetical protein